MPEIRNPTTNETPTETVDRVAGSGGSPPPSVTRNPVSSVKPPVNVHPSAKGVYGSPVDANPILK
jgi:hypothetical protein